MHVSAPVLHYVLPENITPEQRAQLTRSHKKVEQLLGVTPSLRPRAPAAAAVSSAPTSPSGHHRRSRSALAHPSSSTYRNKTQARERGKLRGLFGGVDVPCGGGGGVSEVEDDCEAILHRVSTTDSSTSTSTSSSSEGYSSDEPSASGSTESLPESGTKGRRVHKRRPPPLMLDKSNWGKDAGVVQPVLPTKVTTTSGRNRAPTVVSIDSPITPLVRQRSRLSVLEEERFNRLISDVHKLPITQKDKSKKLNRLGKVFGVLPPLEMVFPPTPNSRSRFDPKRYTLELPPPLVRGVLESLDDEKDSGDSASGSGSGSEEEDVMKVDWETVVDEEGRKRVMNALRSLK